MLNPLRGAAGLGALALLGLSACVPPPPAVGGYAPVAPVYAPAPVAVPYPAVPPLRAEIRPPPPVGPRLVWQPGHWQWNGYEYVWSEGRWVQQRIVAQRWEPGHWVDRGGRWAWEPAGWR